MKVKTTKYLQELINGKWHTIDLVTDEDVWVNDMRFEHRLEKPTAKFRERTIKTPII